MNSKKQDLFLDELSKGENIFLTGKAGTGKSYIVKKAMENLKLAGKQIIALAPTGVAANNIGGQTLHSMFQLNPFGVLDFAACNYMRGEKVRMLNKVDVMFIDEVSMLRPDLFDAINYTLIKNNCKNISKMQIVLIGDLKQLPAPIDDNMSSMLLKFYPGENFFDAKVYPTLNFKTIELDEVLRQTDTEFIEHLNIIREGKKSEYFRKFVSTKPKGIILAPHNATVSRYNIEGLKSVDNKLYEFDASIEGNVKAQDFNLETKVSVKHGCKIMYLSNSKNNNLINGTLGTFKVVNDKKFFISVGEVDYALEPVKMTKKEYVLNDQETELELREIGSITQYPIRLAYALTIHKAQGLTFDEITVDLKSPCFQRGQLYTALSRVVGPAGLTIIVQ